MKIALCNGGLGNQVFQYIFSRWIELATGDACYLDNSAFCRGRVQHNGFEIPRVFPNAQPRLLSDMFTKDVWEYMVDQSLAGKSICQQIKDSGEDIVMVTETEDYQFDGKVIEIPTNSYEPILAKSTGTIYYHGYWINRDWLKKDFFEVLGRELTFAPLTEEYNLRYAEKISESNSVSLHVRRGDFVALEWDAEPDIYREAIECAEKMMEDIHYFVFSDELGWCREHMAEIGLDKRADRVTFVEGNIGKNSFRDMQLMSLCKGNILTTGSSFSYLAALLNTNADRFVVNNTDRKV